MPVSLGQDLLPEVECNAENAAFQAPHLDLGEEEAHSLEKPGGRPGMVGSCWVLTVAWGVGEEYRMVCWGAGMASVGAAGKMWRSRMGLEGWVGQQGEPTGELEELLTAVRAVGPEAVIEEAEEVLSKLAAVAAAVGVGQVLEQHRGKVVGYRPAYMGCSIKSPTMVSSFQLPMDNQVRPNSVKRLKAILMIITYPLTHYNKLIQL